MAITHSVPAWH